MRKLSLVLLTLLSFGLTSLSAADATGDVKKDEKKEEKKDELKFPGKFGLEFSSRFDADIVDNQPKKMFDGDGDLYNRNELKVSMGFDLLKVKDEKGKENTIYTLTPWLKDRFDIKFDFTSVDKFANNVKVLKDASGDLDGITFLANNIYTNVLPRNRFYAGLDNTFKIPKVMDIGINFEARVASDLRKKTTAESVEVKLSPIAVLSGKYGFGLSWKINQLFNFYLYPYYGAIDKTFKGVEFEGTYDLAFEYFHFFLDKKVAEKVKGSIFFSEYLVAYVYSDPYRKASSAQDYEVRAEHIAGLSFDIFGFTPSVAFYAKNYYFQDKKTDTNNVDYVGTKLGVGYAKDWFSVSISYIGRYNVMVNGEDVKKSSLTKTLTDMQNWENHIETAVKFKL